MSETLNEPRFPKPKVLLIDLPPNVWDAVRVAGFNAQTGSFGRPYKIKPDNAFVPVHADPKLPNYSEQENVFIDLTPPQASDQPEEVTPIVDGNTEYWARCNEGLIDPRPVAMASLRCGLRQNP